MKCVYIVSLKYAPGLKKEFVVFGENLRRSGCSVRYVLSRKYQNLEWNCQDMHFLTGSDSVAAVLADTVLVSRIKKSTARLFQQWPPQFVLFYNPHPLNVYISKFTKHNFPNAKLAVYLHEPYKPDKKPYGKVKSAYFYVTELLQSICLEYTDYVILPSLLALRRFRKRHRAYRGQVHLAPILVPDRIPLSNKGRKYFSMVGGVNLATGHQQFARLVKHVATKEVGYPLLLVTSSDLPVYLKQISKKASSVLRLVNQRLITDREIDEAIGTSFAVLRLDEEITQSGVIPVAFMNGTPVIVRNLPGFAQHVKHKYNGYVVSQDCSTTALLEAMDFVKENFPELSANARRSYEETWAEWNWGQYYGWLLDLVRVEACKRVGFQH